MDTERAEIMIKEYIGTITGVKDIGVEIIDDTVVLSMEGKWHIYVKPFTMIGVFIDDDIELSNTLRRYSSNIQHIYESLK